MKKPDSRSTELDKVFIWLASDKLDSLSTELDKVFIWLASDKLTLNTDKSKFMIVSNKKNIPNFSVKVNKLSLKSCDSYKYLCRCDD